MNGQEKFCLDFLDDGEGDEKGCVLVWTSALGCYYSLVWGTYFLIKSRFRVTQNAGSVV